VACYTAAIESNGGCTCTQTPRHGCPHDHCEGLRICDRGGAFSDATDSRDVRALSRQGRHRAAGDTKPLLRLVGMRVCAVNLPADAAILPWPRARSVGRPRSRAAEAPLPSDKPAIITTKAQKQTVERKRITQQRRDHAADPANALVDPIRRANKTAVASVWRDHEDVNLQRRTPKTVSAFRSDDPVDRLAASQTITRPQAWAARRLRIDYERGCLQQHGSIDWSRGGGGGFESGAGPSEYIVMALERFQNAQRALGRSFGVVFSVCIEGGTLKSYAARLGITPSSASGKLLVALQRLLDHYDEVTPKAEEPVRHSIGSQTGPSEPSRWAAD
jgi:Domain of unknown function (DUF6456)